MRLSCYYDHRFVFGKLAILNDNTGHHLPVECGDALCNLRRIMVEITRASAPLQRGCQLFPGKNSAGAGTDRRDVTEPGPQRLAAVRSLPSLSNPAYPVQVEESKYLGFFNHANFVCGNLSARNHHCS